MFQGFKVLVSFMMCQEILAFLTQPNIRWNININRDRVGDRVRKSRLHNNNGPSDKDDFISKIFGWAMPKPQQVGLSRYTEDSLPENYPATKKEWAVLTEYDKDEDMQLIRPLLARTNLVDRKLKLAFYSKRDGLSKEKFHSKVDGKGPAVVLLRTKDGVTCGGYNPCGWVNLGESRGSIAAFLFLITEEGQGMGPDDKYIKLQKIGGAGMAQMDNGGGPSFGAEGLSIPFEKTAKPYGLGLVRSKLGLYYENLPGGERTLLGKKQFEAEIEEFKVFVGDWSDYDRIPYSGAMFFQVN